MAGKGDEKEKKPAENQKKEGNGGEKKGGGAEKKEEGPPKVVFKVDLHCEGCASKIKRSIKGFEGVEGVTTDMATSKLTVIGKVDAWKLRERVEAKTRKKVEFLSPANPPKKSADGDKKPAAAPTGAGDAKEKKNTDDKKPKEPAATTVVLKIRLHCDGCIRRIKKTILKIKGVQDVSVDAQKDLVTVKGFVDVTSLPSYLKEKLNRSVEVIPSKNNAAASAAGGGDEKKDKPAGPAGGGEKKEKNGGGGGDGEKKDKDGGGKKESPAAGAAVGPVAMEANKMDYYGGGGTYGYKAEMLHAPQIFSDENPNACTVM